jgi:hypothetical protein
MVLPLGSYEEEKLVYYKQYYTLYWNTPSSRTTTRDLALLNRKKWIPYQVRDDKNIKHTNKR